jgi:hypothetical protein
MPWQKGYRPAPNPIPYGPDVLASWAKLNKFLRKAGEVQCGKLLKVELKGRRRKMFVKRIHSRLNKIRAVKERAALDKLVRGES